MGNFYTDTIRNDPRFDSIDPIHDLALLEPVTRGKVQQIIADAAAQGIKLMAYETYRSQDRQTALYNQGATQLKEVGVHHYGLAWFSIHCRDRCLGVQPAVIVVETVSIGDRCKWLFVEMSEKIFLDQEAIF
jgi:hypothetical protein